MQLKFHVEIQRLHTAGCYNSSANFMTRNLVSHSCNLRFKPKKPSVHCKVFSVLNYVHVFFLWRQGYKPCKNRQAYLKSCWHLLGSDNFFWKQTNKNPIQGETLPQGQYAPICQVEKTAKYLTQKRSSLSFRFWKTVRATVLAL